MDNSSVCFPDVLAVLEKLTGTRRYWVAYSGGLDSTALLHLMSVNRQLIAAEIIAIHVDHQISENSIAWSSHCTVTCKQYGIILKQIKVDARYPEGTGLEAHARQLRYDAIKTLMDKDDVLLTAHHQDDLAETYLLQLMRGAGPDGLAGMPQIRNFGKGHIVRPLLNINREQLETYARENNLVWVEDESNYNLDFDRNYIRTRVLSCLEQRWPSAKKTIARSAGHLADLIEILKETGELDFQVIQGKSKDILNIDRLNELTGPRKRNILRYWLKLNGHQIPNSNILNRILSELLTARIDSSPLVKWQDTEVRRYRNQLMVLKPSCSSGKEKSYTWHLEEPLNLEWGSLYAKQVTGKGIRASSVIDKTIDVRFRSGGEKIYPAGRHETHKLKKMFQEAGIPPWRRKKIPLLYIDNQLAAVPGYWIDEKFNADKMETGWDISLIEH